MKRPLPIDTDGKSIARCGGSTREGELLKGGTSMAAGLARVKQGRKMSAGWELELGMREGTSFLGTKLQTWQQKTAHHAQSCASKFYLHYPQRQ